MAAEESRTDPYFELVNAANRFLFTVLPLRRVASREALSAFTNAVRLSGLSPINVDPILMRTLAVLTSQARGWLPSLVDRYLAASPFPGSVVTFAQCVSDLLRHRGIEDPEVEAAILFLESNFRDSRLEPAIVAAQLGLHLDDLRCRFTNVTGVTLAGYQRGLRLEEAARLLGTTALTVKEIWTRVGYNHHANFCHEFQERFGVSPTQYREQTNSREVTSHPHGPSQAGVETTVVPKNPWILVVDDDVYFNATTADLFSRAGYRVSTAEDATSCFNAVQEGHFDAIVLDYRLGEDDGLDVLRSLRRSSSRPPVVLFSADWSVESHAGEVWSLGATTLFKLTDFDNLERLVRGLCAMSIGSA